MTSSSSMMRAARSLALLALLPFSGCFCHREVALEFDVGVCTVQATLSVSGLETSFTACKARIESDLFDEHSLFEIELGDDDTIDAPSGCGRFQLALAQARGTSYRGEYNVAGSFDDRYPGDGAPAPGSAFVSGGCGGDRDARGTLSVTDFLFTPGDGPNADFQDDGDIEFDTQVETAAFDLSVSLDDVTLLSDGEELPASGSFTASGDNRVEEGAGGARASCHDTVNDVCTEVASSASQEEADAFFGNCEGGNTARREPCPDGGQHRCNGATGSLADGSSISINVVWYPAFCEQNPQVNLVGTCDSLSGSFSNGGGSATPCQ